VALLWRNLFLSAISHQPCFLPQRHDPTGPALDCFLERGPRNPAVTGKSYQILNVAIVVVPELIGIWKVERALRSYASLENKKGTSSRSSWFGHQVKLATATRQTAMITLLIVVAIVLVGSAAFGFSGLSELNQESAVIPCRVFGASASAGSPCYCSRQSDGCAAKLPAALDYS
jgi:hypothetical protein